MKSSRAMAMLLAALLSFPGCFCLSQGAARAVTLDTPKQSFDFRSQLAKLPFSQKDIDRFGWQMFTSFNWPAMPDERGKPDPARTFGEPGTVVWETWKSPSEVFYPDGSRPPAWDAYGTHVPSECAVKGMAVRDRLGGGMPRDTVLTEALVYRVNQTEGGSMVDQNGNIVHYSIAFNKPVFDYIVNNGYYTIDGQAKMSGQADFIINSVEMKAAWRVLLPTESEAVKKRYFHRYMYVYTPPLSGEATCNYQEMALIGLHFNLKVEYPDRSTHWIMATFEQVDNAPPFGTPDQPGKDAAHKLPYSLFDKDCYGAGTLCQYNQRFEDGRALYAPTQVIRTVDIDPAAKALNPVMQAQFRKLLPDSPWQYYEMITTQFPSSPDSGATGKPQPASAANSSMETYVTQSSCLGCHATAQDAAGKYSSDYSFMLRDACPKPLFPSQYSSAELAASACASR